MSPYGLRRVLASRQEPYPGENKRAPATTYRSDANVTIDPAAPYKAAAKPGRDNGAHVPQINMYTIGKSSSLRTMHTRCRNVPSKVDRASHALLAGLIAPLQCPATPCPAYLCTHAHVHNCTHGSFLREKQVAPGLHVQARIWMRDNFHPTSAHARAAAAMELCLVLEGLLPTAAASLVRAPHGSTFRRNEHPSAAIGKYDIYHIRCACGQAVYVRKCGTYVILPAPARSVAPNGHVLGAWLTPCVISQPAGTHRRARSCSGTGAG